MRFRWLVSAAVVMAVWCAGGAAQHRRVEALAPGVEFAPLSFEEAVAEAKRRTRLLVVYRCKPGSIVAAEMDRKMWKNPTLALYIEWHCIAIKQPGGLDGRVTVYKDGQAIAEIRSGGLGGYGKGKLPGSLTGGKTLRDPTPPTPGAVALLFTLDYEMQKLQAADPVWHMMHGRVNPPPEPPPMPPPFYLSDDGLADVIEDPLPGDAGVDVWERLELARRAAGVGNLHYATGLYTWLWEKGEEVEPALGPARRSFLAAEIAALAVRREPARERFMAIRDARARRLLWAEYDDYHEWCVLNAVVGEDDMSVEWFDYFINDDHEATMLPRADKAAYEVLLAREGFGDPWELGADPVGRVEQISGLLGRSRPATVPMEDWERLQIFLRKHLLHEGCRLHAACLRAGREEDAERIVGVVLRTHDTAEARAAVVATVLVAGEVRGMHATLLEEAEGLGVGRGDLRERLAAMLMEGVEVGK